MESSTSLASVSAARHRPEAERYSAPAIVLHWTMALLIVGLLALGLYMTGLALSPEKLKLYSWHKWAGVCAFLLAVVRLAWRVRQAPPPLPAGMPAAIRLAAHAGHGLLYVLMFAIPLSGWLMSSAKGFQTVWFGVLPLPDLVEKNRELGDLLQSLHWGLNMILIAAIAGHLAAALKHHFIDRDGVLARMLPGRRHNKENA
ncbi:cytochrome b [Noviherbaspirillum aridicola]|uniref:Cytochrome b n=1 Tax=Noviherbaspirillum aridicola TaxID=2849687 RepID=A0ABQ4Q0J3_9BURK|nr:cytochrome b [Noviherbaspirillum aridicola]GIZ50305.1 cytochrome b [Noviherbaspirillum aridicola]